MKQNSLLKTAEALPNSFPGLPAELDAAILDAAIIDQAQIALNTVLAGAAEFIKHWNKRQSRNIALKPGHQFVTDADLSIDRLMTAQLQNSCSGIDIISEELNPSVTIEHRKPFWILDPIDGTVALIFETSPLHPAIMLAFCESAAVTALSVVYLPFADQWFLAVRGAGVFCTSTADSFRWQRIFPNQTACSLANSWVFFNPYGDAKLETELFAKLKCELQPPSCALATVDTPHSFCSIRTVLNSGPDVVIHDNGAHSLKQGPWDIIPPKLFVEELGGAFVNAKLEEINPFKPEMSIVVRSPELLAEIARYLT